MTSEERVRRGFIHLVDLSTDGEGGSQSADRGRRRPALVVQNDLGNLSSDTTIVVALSSRLPSRPYPFHVMLPAEILGKPGIIMCEQIWTLSLARLDPLPLAECPPELMHQVEEALRHSLGFSVETAEQPLS
jgi:mRNA interferase MazF